VVHTKFLPTSLSSSSWYVNDCNTSASFAAFSRRNCFEATVNNLNVYSYIWSRDTNVLQENVTKEEFNPDTSPW
jgi:hypothetical protein